MHNGRLAASGRHDELMRDADGLYAHLYKLQLQPDPAENPPPETMKSADHPALHAP
jgi:hypothetical protein